MRADDFWRLVLPTNIELVSGIHAVAWSLIKSKSLHHHVVCVRALHWFQTRQGCGGTCDLDRAGSARTPAALGLGWTSTRPFWIRTLNVGTFSTKGGGE